MKDIDQAIRHAVSKEDAEFLAKLESEPAPLHQITGVFQGPLKALYKFYLLGAVAAGFVGVYSGWRFAMATETRPLFYWGAIAFFCLVVIASSRTIFIMEMNTNRLLREIKKLELQISLLASKRSD